MREKNDLSLATSVDVSPSSVSNAFTAEASPDFSYFHPLRGIGGILVKKRDINVAYTYLCGLLQQPAVPPNLAGATCVHSCGGV